jgi:hypothetical protein
MAEPQAFDNDPVGRFLDFGSPAAMPAELRQMLLSRTTRVLRRRRRLRRAAYVLALIGCYLLGLGTRHLGTPPAPTHSVLLSSGSHTAARTPASGSLQAALPLDGQPEVPAFVLERMAQSCPENRSELYRRAGDGYLAQGDFASAVHCYGRSLDAGSETDWIVTKDDNWLLMQLKTARREEKVYAKSAG